MDMNRYQKWTSTTAIYRDKCDEWTERVSYAALGLVGEAGEIANKIKKVIRDGRYNREELVGEMGDVLWYLARMCEENDTTLEEIALTNMHKLNDRYERGVISGSGDHR